MTVHEANADLGKGTPYHPRANDRAMLANIASIELPPVCESLTVDPASFVLGITSAAELGSLAAAAIIEDVDERRLG